MGSGKSTVATQFANLGVPVIDTDEISRELTAPGAVLLADIRRALGDGVFAADGSLDRSATRKRIFADAAARLRLEAILHPAIRAEVERRLAAIKDAYVILMVPLFVETGGYRDLARRVVVVDCDESQQLRRVAERSGLSVDQARAVLAAQASRSARLAVANHVLDNRGEPARLSDQVRALHEELLRSAQTS
jgi:dephospho-CoA kinase